MKYLILTTFGKMEKENIKRRYGDTKFLPTGKIPITIVSCELSPGDWIAHYGPAIGETPVYFQEDDPIGEEAEIWTRLQNDSTPSDCKYRWFVNIGSGEYSGCMPGNLKSGEHISELSNEWQAMYSRFFEVEDPDTAEIYVVEYEHPQ